MIKLYILDFFRFLGFPARLCKHPLTRFMTTTWFSIITFSRGDQSVRQRPRGFISSMLIKVRRLITLNKPWLYSRSFKTLSLCLKTQQQEQGLNDVDYKTAAAPSLGWNLDTRCRLEIRSHRAATLWGSDDAELWENRHVLSSQSHWILSVWESVFVGLVLKITTYFRVHV